MNNKELPVKKLKFFAIFTIALLILLILLYITINMFFKKISFENDVLALAEKNSKNIFSINEIIYFSSSNADASIASNSSFLIENLYQYTDIAIFLDNTTSSNTLSLENTLKEVYIDNINFSSKPEIGIPSLYYKNINKFATPSFLEENLITDKLVFNISSEDESDLNFPTLYNNCANPITLSYVNNNIKTDYTLDDFTNTYDGSLLKKCSIPLTDINCEISFDIHITNNLGQEFICPIHTKIPLEQEDNISIYDGKIILKDSTNYVFYRSK